MTNEIFEQTMLKVKEMDDEIIRRFDYISNPNNCLTQFIALAKANMANYEKNRDLTVFDKLFADFSVKNLSRKKKDATFLRDDTSKENTPLETTGEVSKKESSVFEVSRQPLKAIQETDKKLAVNPIIKLERLSTVTAREQQDPPIVAAAAVKTEPAEMPPPEMPVKKGRPKKKTTTAVKKERTSSTSTRPTRGRPRKNTERKDTSSVRSSDVVLQSPNISVVTVDDSDEPDERPKRTTRARTKRTETESAKRPRSVSVEKRTTAVVKKKKSSAKETDVSQYEDAVSQNEEFATPLEGTFVLSKSQRELLSKTNAVAAPLEGTFVLTKSQRDLLSKTNLVDPTAPLLPAPAENVNETIVVRKASAPNNQTVVLSKAPVNETIVIEKNKELTDVPSKSSAKTTKAIFNPFENSPVKKRVEAFERLVKSPAADGTLRSTRSKMRNKKKEAAEETEENTNKETKKTSLIPVKEKKSTLIGTPLSNRHVPHSSISEKIKRFGSSSATKAPNSALKSSQQAFREQEKRRKEKEAEALKKKETLMRLQSEEAKRKREEKELKAKQQREALEKEKLKLIEQQKLKEEKHKLQQQKRQEKLAKEREEAEKKRALARQRREEERRRVEEEEEERLKEEESRVREEEARQRAEEERSRKEREETERAAAEEKRRKEEKERLKEKQMQEKLALANREGRKVPIYMVNKPPLLPTYDCYDSDEEDVPESAIPKPTWIRRDVMSDTLKTMNYIDDKIKNTLFSMKPQSPNLREIFENIDPKKMQRNSSALWNYKPRFTLMSMLSEEDV